MPDQRFAQWKTRSRRTVLESGKFLRVEYHEVELPDGRVIEEWPWVITPDFVNIVAVTPDERFVCFRQNKYAIAGTSIAVVGGYLEPGEEPLAAAQRELREESGYEADDWTALAAFPVDANRGAGNAYFFLARAARKVADPIVDDLEDQELLLLTREEVKAALLQGEIKTMPWAAVLSLALLHT
jgi:ADP-ribose pyrophosphatase